MMTTLSSCLIPLLLLAAPSPSGQPPDPKTTSDISGELAKLNQAVREIADLLAKQSEGQKLDLFMKRLELASGKVAQLEQRQRSLQSEKTSIEDEKQRVETGVRQIQSQVDAPANESEKAGLEAAIERADGQLKRFASRLQSLSQEIAEVEAQLGTQRQELKEWQNLMDRRLSGF